MTHRGRDILKATHDAGVTLIVEGNELKYRAPAGAMTQELRDALRELKPDLVYEYQERAGILEYDAHMSRTDAESRAASLLNGSIA